MSGVTTVSASVQPSPASASRPSTSMAAAAEADDDDEIEMLKEQSLDEVLEVKCLADITCWAPAFFLIGICCATKQSGGNHLVY